MCFRKKYQDAQHKTFGEDGIRKMKEEGGRRKGRREEGCRRGGKGSIGGMPVTLWIQLAGC